MQNKILNNQDEDYLFLLQCSLRQYIRNKLKERLREEGIPITSSALDSAAEIHSEKLIKTVEICSSNLIETDITNLRDIFETIKMKETIRP